MPENKQPATGGDAQKCAADINMAMAHSESYNTLKTLPKGPMKDLVMGAVANGVIEGVQSVDPACKGVTINRAGKLTPQP